MDDKVVSEYKIDASSVLQLGLALRGGYSVEKQRSATFYLVNTHTHTHTRIVVNQSDNVALLMRSSSPGFVLHVCFDFFPTDNLRELRVSVSPPTPASASSSGVFPQQFGKAFFVRYCRLLHEHSGSLHRSYSRASTLMKDDPTKALTRTEAITKRIE